MIDVVYLFISGGVAWTLQRTKYHFMMTGYYYPVMRGAVNGWADERTSMK
jgi:hypothetical protein